MMSTSTPATVVLAAPAVDRYWVRIDRDHGPNVMVGPYPTREAAEHAEQEAPLVDYLLSPAGGGGVDTAVHGIRAGREPGNLPGFPQYDWHWIDLADPHHTGA